MLSGNPTSADGTDLLEALPVNYRPPSAFGRAIPTSLYFYHADPSQPRSAARSRLPLAPRAPIPLSSPPRLTLPSASWLGRGRAHVRSVGGN